MRLVNVWAWRGKSLSWEGSSVITKQIKYPVGKFYSSKQADGIRKRKEDDPQIENT
uniref:Uncharacterized protein n=1 Tax=Nelumbo nucifera TaxID=4432 RepID=A0A822XWW6_NELNU|nr:TPA_asm: hypothetical protein HUJ06_026274 [Nelumbo nucifera]